MRYMITHSLLSSWLYAIMPVKYETDKDPMEDFLRVLRREPTPDNEALAAGRHFEDLVTAIAENNSVDIHDKEYEAAEKIANIVKGGQFQVPAYKTIKVNNTDIFLYGRLDVLKAGEIYDIKHSKSYERGKYIDSTQHQVYMELVPEAKSFTYLISNGRDVWTERYLREEVQPIQPVVSDFINWLQHCDFYDMWTEYWETKT